jgi:hypothetical protein
MRRLDWEKKRRRSGNGQGAAAAKCESKKRSSSVCLPVCASQPADCLPAASTHHGSGGWHLKTCTHPQPIHLEHTRPLLKKRSKYILAILFCTESFGWNKKKRPKNECRISFRGWKTFL